jgi:hypothetical protein
MWTVQSSFVAVAEAVLLSPLKVNMCDSLPRRRIAMNHSMPWYGDGVVFVVVDGEMRRLHLLHPKIGGSR